MVDDCHYYGDLWCFYGDSGRRTDECLKRIKMIVSRCQHVCFAGAQCRISSDSWQNKSHQSDIFCKRLVADFLRAKFPEAKVNCCKPLSPELIINARFCGKGLLEVLTKIRARRVGFFLLWVRTGRVLAKKFGYRDGSGRVVRQF